MGDWLYLIIGIAVVGVLTLVGLLTSGRRRRAAPPGGSTDVIVPPPPGTDTAATSDAPPEPAVATAGHPVQRVPGAVDDRERERGQHVAGRAPGDDGVRARRGDAPDELPGQAEAAQGRRVERLLEPGQQQVLLVADVLVQDGEDALQQGITTGVTGARTLELGDELLLLAHIVF